MTSKAVKVTLETSTFQEEKMEKRTLGKTGYEISPVVFGGIVNMNETQADADRFVRFAVEQGVNYFDVAPTYGDAETRLGPALAPYRSQVYLACKTEKRDAAQAKAALLNSLKLLQTDHFDVYQLHAMATEQDVEQAFGPDGVMETVLWAKKEGLIRKIGFSTHSEDVALHCLDLFAFDTVLFPMNWALGLNTGWGNRISERKKKDGFGLLAMKTLVQRTWREGEEKVYPKSWCKPIFNDDALAIAAMKYGIYKGADTLVPPGNFEHFSFMLQHREEWLNQPLTEQELQLLKNEAQLVREEMIF